MSWCSLILVAVVLMHHATLNPTPLDDLTINFNLNDGQSDEEISGDETFDENQEVKAGQTNEVTALVIGGFGPDIRKCDKKKPITQRITRIFKNGKWFADRILTDARKGMGTATFNNLVHIAGGIDKEDNILDSVLYRTGDGISWRDHSVLTQKRAYATMNVIQYEQDPNTLMVTGGMNEFGQALSSTEIYIHAVGWQVSTAMFDTRYGHASAVLGGRLFVLGGRGSCMFTGSATEIFDMNSQTGAVLHWRGPTLTEERSFPAAAVLENGNEALIYICGGYRGTNESHYITTCEKGNENGFVKITNPIQPQGMNYPRAQFGLLNIGTELWAIGGFNIIDGELKSMEKYKDERWEVFPKESFMKCGRKLFGAAAITINTK